MPLTRLTQAKKKTVGTKQTLKAVERGQARVVFVARDADEHVVQPVLRAAAAKGIEVIRVDSMQLLGRACGIDVGCASAAVIEE